MPTTSRKNCTPFEMVYGRPPTEIPQQLRESDYPAVESYLDKLIVDQRVAHDALILARYRTAETVNKRRNPKHLLQGWRLRPISAQDAGTQQVTETAVNMGQSILGDSYERYHGKLQVRHAYAYESASVVRNG
jgi:hypothetical protein